MLKSKVDKSQLLNSMEVFETSISLHAITLQAVMSGDRMQILCVFPLFLTLCDLNFQQCWQHDAIVAKALL
jgi:hypothetical protein